MMRGTAVVYLPGDGRLEILCSVILRQMGHRVYEAGDVPEATSMIEASGTVVFVSTPEIADDPRVARLCARHGVKCVTVGAEERIATLLPLLERRAAPR